MNTLQERIAELFNGEMPSDDLIISHIDFSLRHKKAERIETRLRAIISYLFDYKHKARYMIPASWDDSYTTMSDYNYLSAKDEWSVELVHYDSGFEKYAEIIIPNSWIEEDDWKPLIDAVTDALRQKEDMEKSAAAKEKFKNKLASIPPATVHSSMESAWIEISNERGCVFMGNAHEFRNWVKSTKPSWLNDRVITAKVVDDFAYEYHLKYTLEHLLP